MNPFNSILGELTTSVRKMDTALVRDFANALVKEKPPGYDRKTQSIKRGIYFPCFVEIGFLKFCFWIYHL